MKREVGITAMAGRWANWARQGALGQAGREGEGEIPVCEETETSVCQSVRVSWKEES